MDIINHDNTFTYSNNEVHYYGTNMTVTNNNDVSLLTRGSVWYLRDNEPSNSHIIQHPYIVLQNSYIDKDGMITVFGISSSPTYINMIPIIVNGSITYINPYKPHMHHISEFVVKSYIGTVVNPVVLDLLGDMYGMTLGLNLYRTDREIIDAYMNYVDEFNIRSVKYTRYNSNRRPASECIYKNELELKISFPNMYDDTGDDINVVGNVFANDDEVVMPEELVEEYIAISEEPIEEVVMPEELVEESIVISEEPIEEVTVAPEKPVEEKPVFKEYTPKKNKNGGKSNKKKANTTITATRQYLKIDEHDKVLIDAINVMESEPAGKVVLPIFNRMDNKDVSIFMLYIKMHGSRQASLLYNCCKNTIDYRRKQIEKFYNIDFVK